MIDKQTSDQTTTKWRYALGFASLIAALLLLPMVFVWLFNSAMAVTLLWDWANALGYLAAVALLLLFVYAGRSKSSPPFNGRFFYNFHRDLGIVALLLSAAHIGVLLYDDPLVLEHMKYAAPWYMLAGLGAMVLILLLGLFSGHWARLTLWPSYSRFQRFHLYLSLLMLALLIWHIAGAHFYLNHWLKQLLFALALLWVLWGFYRWRHRNLHISGPKLAIAAWSLPLALIVLALVVMISWLFIAYVGAYEA